MPKRNAVKVYAAENYYHLYNRGVDHASIFRHTSDYHYFLKLLERYLSDKIVLDKNGRVLPDYSAKLDLVAYCLMPNHYHMLIYLKEFDGLEKFMRSVMTSYSMYFNKKYKRSGTLFEGPYLASRITNDTYFWHISRYIHLNPYDISKHKYLQYPFSSLKYFISDASVHWLHPEYIVETEREKVNYLDFVCDYTEYHDTFKQIKDELANLA